MHLRLPTPQCAPNFAFLMAIDARDAVARLPEVGDVTVVLDDHYTGAEINAALVGGGTFADAFPGEETAHWTSCERSSGARRCSPARAASATRC